MSKELTPLPRLVFLEAGEEEPFTTDEIIASCAQVQRKVVSNLIRRYKADLENFGILHFKNAKPTAGSEGGRPHIFVHIQYGQRLAVKARQEHIHNQQNIQ